MIKPQHLKQKTIIFAKYIFRNKAVFLFLKFEFKKKGIFALFLAFIL